MVYHYFGSKEAIYRAALVDVYNRIEGVEFHAVESAAKPTEKLKHLLDSYFRFLDQNPEFTQMVQWENIEKGRHIVKKNHLLSKDPFLARFRKIVEDGVKLGEFRRDLNIRHLLIHFIGSCFIYHSNRFSLSQGLSINLGDPRVRAEGLRMIRNLIFDGLKAPHSGKPR